MSNADQQHRSKGEGSLAAGIQVISRAAAILRALQGENGGLSLAQIAERVGLPRSTVQRIVTALSDERLLMTASPNGRVRLGPGLLALAADSRLDVAEIAHPFLKELSQKTGETVDLSVLRRDYLIFLDQVVGDQRLRAVSAVGEAFPLTSTANGKAVLAMLDDDAVRTIVSRNPTPRLSMEALAAELAEVRRTGLAYDREEHTAGISAVGVAFADVLGSLYAVSVPVPTHRFREKEKALGEELLQVKQKIVRKLHG